jgi:nicotinate-nucleotide adenylyltransferase
MALTALFGGTFDPVHNGHLAIASEAAGRFDLERVLFVPASIPPHKAGGAVASYADRLRMVEIACAPDPRFEASAIEAGTVKNYSIDTVERLHAAGVSPIAFLIGADAFAEIRTWHRWTDLVAAVEFIVVTRPGAAYDIPPGAKVRRLDGLDLAISPSDIRARIAAGDTDVPIPPAVLRYILGHGLYRSQAS